MTKNALISLIQAQDTLATTLFGSERYDGYRTAISGKDDAKISKCLYAVEAEGLVGGEALSKFKELLAQ